MVILRSESSITLSEDNIVTTNTPIMEPNDSLGGTIFHNLLLHKEKIAQIDAKTGKMDTYGQLLKKCVRTALHMRTLGITHDHVVTLCTTNHQNACVPYIATLFLGAKLAPIDPSFSPEEMAHLFKEVQPQMIYVVPEVVPVIENLCVDAHIVVFGDTDRYITFCTFLEECEYEEEFTPVKVKDLGSTALIHFSSGTTGLPKGICLSHYALVGQVLNFLVTENPDFEYMKKQAGRVHFPLTHLGYTSLYWVSATVMLLSSILQGYCRLISPDFDPSEIWDLIGVYKPVVLVLTPVQVMEMLEKRKCVNMRSVLSIVIIGSSISKEWGEKLQGVFPEADVTRSYGLTEVCGILTTFKGNDLYHRPLMKLDSVGLPIRAVSYKVVDLESGKNVGPNQPGELRVKSQFVMNGYYHQDSSDSFDEFGWLKTGDVVYYDDDYCFYVVDRIREAFKYRGWFIAPTLIETELLNHPRVRNAVVIGVPEEDGYHPMGVVVVDESCGVKEKEIEKYVEERVPERYRLRAGVKFVKFLPLTVTGKVKRGEIRRRILEEK